MNPKTKTGHTPGPWMRDGYQPDYITNTDGRNICQVSTHEDEAGEDLANARLIAAAPEMLDALRGLVHAIDYLNLDHSGWNEMDDARKAISRATEGTP